MRSSGNEHNLRTHLYVFFSSTPLFLLFASLGEYYNIVGPELRRNVISRFKCGIPVTSHIGRITLLAVGQHFRTFLHVLFRAQIHAIASHLISGNEQIAHRGHFFNVYVFPEVLLMTCGKYKSKEKYKSFVSTNFFFFQVVSERKNHTLRLLGY